MRSRDIQVATGLGQNRTMATRFPGWLVAAALCSAGVCAAQPAAPAATAPPRYIRAELYRYKLAPRRDRAYWRRERLGAYMPPLSADDERLRSFLLEMSWLIEKK